MFENLFSSVLTMSFSASIVIVLVLLLRFALKKVPKIYSYVLWGLVLLRLLCPVFPETRLSVMPRDMSIMSALEQAAEQDSAQPEMPVPDFRENLTQSIPADNPTLTQQVQKPIQDSQNVPEPEIPVVSPPVEQPVADAADVRDKAPVQVSGWQIGSIVWLAGIWVMAFYGVWSLFRLKSLLVGAVDLGNNVYLADHIDTPFVMGLFRPRIYLPSFLKKNQAEYIILHEKYHVRRLDHIAKLFFFAALCIHWFNPLVWLAFVLMGHDMEMSCDEAVMEELSDDVRTDYAASLLRLSTGRRRIAPTPLAFGEGDPKGRIKNVLNYRKPQFWVAIVAVAVCIIAAVCLLTNPVKTDREFLNYPGLRWGMSPEEVKSALELTEDNIVMDDGETPDGEFEWNDPPHYVIAAKGLTCFGEETTLAKFLFYDYSLTCENFALETVELYYPDEHSADPVDMKKLQRNISRYYGDPVEQMLCYDAGMPGTDPQIKIDDIPEGHAHWLSQDNMDSYLSQEQKDALYALYESANKDKETFIANRELYDLRYQATWPVSVFCDDHYGPSDGFPNDMAEEGYTSNFVRISANGMHTVDSYLQYAKDGVLPDAIQPVEPQEPDGMLNYPGLSWGMKLDEVVAALGKSTADFTELQEEGREGMSYQLNGAVFADGLDYEYTMDMTFRFSAAGGLNGIRITFPEGQMLDDEPVAMQELEWMLGTHFGNRANNYGYYPAPGAKGISEEYNHSSDVSAWLSAQTLKEAFQEETLDAYRKAYFPDASDKDWDAYITHKRLVTVKTTKDEAKFLLKQESAEPPVAVAVFDAEEYVTILENVVREGPDPLLNYPGLQWGMTPEQVKLSLRLRDEQIKSESGSEEGTDYTINVTDLECFGEKVNLAVFRFLDGSKVGGPYGLYDIMLFYPDQQCADPVDMEKIVSAVTACYGEPDQEIVIKDSGLNATTRPVPEGQYYWHSELDFDAYLTQEQKDLLYQDAIHKLVDKEDGDREFADKRWKQNWLSQIWVMDDYLGDLDVDRKDGPTDYCVNLTAGKTWVDSRIRELSAWYGYGWYFPCPYLSWGMYHDTVREYCEHRGLTIESDVLENTDGLKRTIVLSGTDFFGHSVKKLVLEYVGEKETNLRPSFVRVVLDSNASASDIWDELQTRYGREPETYWDCALVDGTYTEQVHKPATAVSVWPSFGSLKTRYSEYELAELRKMYESENGVKVSDADWAKFAENRYLVSLMFGVNGKANPNREAEDSDCIVIDYDASELIAYDAKVAKIRQSYDAARLNYPGLDWGMTPEEVKAALGFGDDSIVKVQESENVMLYAVKGLHYFNLPADIVQFNYTSFKGSQWGLYEVVVTLPDDTDMEQAKQTVTAYYGEPIDSYTHTDELTGKAITEKSEKGNELWLSQTTVANSFSEAELEYYWQFLRGSSGAMFGGGYNRDTVMESARTTPMARMNVTDDLWGKVYPEFPDAERIKAVRYHSAVFDTEQFFDYYREQVEHIGMLNYPGLNWGMTPEEVQSIWGYSDEDVEINDGGQVLHYQVKGLRYMGLLTDMVQFNYTSFQGSQWGLYEVIVVLPDDTDMESTKQIISSYYGEPVDSYTYTDKNTGKLVTETSEEGKPLWVSPATMGNTFSTAQQEFYWRVYQHYSNSLPNLTYDGFMEGLRTAPLVRVVATDNMYGEVYNAWDPNLDKTKCVYYDSDVTDYEQFFAHHADEIGEG